MYKLGQRLGLEVRAALWSIHLLRAPSKTNGEPLRANFSYQWFGQKLNMKFPPEEMEYNKARKARGVWRENEGGNFLNEA